jgi:RNA polymerase sigma-70 factor (ECF subfamily)
MLALETDPEELVHRIVAGDRHAEGELVARYGEGLRFVTQRWVRDAATAEDLCQETFRLALTKIRGGEVREPGQIVAFLRSLAKNLSTQLYRRAEHRRTVAGEPEALNQLPDPGRGQLAELLDREERQRVRKVLAELGTDRDREVLFRFYIAEQSTERICADLQLPAEHLYRVLHRARARYRKLFERSAGAEA